MKKLFAKKIIQKYKPILVLVCGSWGKSMAIETSKVVLRKAGLKVNDTKKDFLSSILYPGKKSFLSLLKTLFIKNGYPQVVFIENHHDDILPQDLVNLFEQQVVVIPYISAHDIQNFGGIEKYLQKNCLMTKRLAKNLNVIYNYDINGLSGVIDTLGLKSATSISTQTETAKYKSLKIGFRFAEDAHITNDHRVQGITFKLQNGGATLPLRLTGGVGKQHVYPILITLALAKMAGVNIVESLSVIRDLKILPGRMKIMPGIKKTILLDDTYDIDAESAYETLQVAAEIPLQEGQRRIAVLGDMVSYGADSKKVHCLLGEEIASMKFDVLICIGERSHDIAKCAVKAGMPDDEVFHFIDQVEAGKFIQERLKQGDLVVVKGSKEHKLETIIKELMAFPLKAKEDLLVR